ncbi:hypothetical protein HK102_008504 [Quaeritorhiza haematococci]|nr:hypothetical protein HK102_008504 [Quaeritorhiza haematococci]
MAGGEEQELKHIQRDQETTTQKQLQGNAPSQSVKLPEAKQKPEKNVELEDDAPTLPPRPPRSSSLSETPVAEAPIIEKIDLHPAIQSLKNESLVLEDIRNLLKSKKAVLLLPMRSTVISDTSRTAFFETHGPTHFLARRESSPEDFPSITISAPRVEHPLDDVVTIDVIRIERPIQEEDLVRQIFPDATAAAGSSKPESTPMVASSLNLLTLPYTIATMIPSFFTSTSNAHETFLQEISPSSFLHNDPCYRRFAEAMADPRSALLITDIAKFIAEVSRPNNGSLLSPELQAAMFQDFFTKMRYSIFGLPHVRTEGDVRKQQIMDGLESYVFAVTYPK